MIDAVLLDESSEPPSSASERRLAGINAFTQRRRQDSREKLLSAGLSILCKQGYSSVTIDEIARSAGVSRLTFYRHFGSKSDLLVVLYRRLIDAAMPRLLGIRDLDYEDRAAVLGWLGSIFEADRIHRHLQRGFFLATADEPALSHPARDTVREVIAGLGEKIPSFAFEEDAPEAHRRWLQAWLIIFEILSQGRHAALDYGVANDPEVIELLADRFMNFVREGAS